MANRVTKEEVQEFVRLRKSGKTKKEISEITGRSESSIVSHLLKNGFTSKSLEDPNWRRDLLNKLVKPERELEKDFSFWKGQSKELDKLIEDFPNLDFWKSIKVLHPVKTLYCFRSVKAKKWLTSKYKEFLYKPKETKEYELSEKFGEDKKITKKARSTRGFLNG